jgi:hypothetical protein
MRDELKIIEICREEALDFIFHECQNSIGSIFSRLRYDGETLFLVAGDSSYKIDNIVDKNIYWQRLMKKMEDDFILEYENLNLTPITDKRIPSSLQRIE